MAVTGVEIEAFRLFLRGPLNPTPLHFGQSKQFDSRPLSREIIELRAYLVSIPCAIEGSDGTGKRIMVGTWLREISFCSSFTVLSGIAWVLLIKICQPFFLSPVQ